MAVEEPSELTILQSRHRKELEKWDALGVNIGDITTQGGPVHMSLRIDALSRALVESNVLDEDDLNRIFLEISLEVLPKMREEIEPAVQQARIDAIKNGRMH